MLGGMLALGLLLMGIIYGVAALFRSDQPTEDRPVKAVDAARQDTSRKGENNARTRVPLAYAPENWPTYPGRSTGGHVAAAAASRAAAAGAGSVASTPSPPPIPVGVPVEDYRADVEAGKKVFLPNPKGECTLTVAGSAAATSGLEGCLASQAAKPGGG